MNIYNIVATNNTQKWITKHDIDLRAMSSALSLLVSEIHPTVKVRLVTLRLQIKPNGDSEYWFNTNKIYLCDKPYKSGASKTKQRKDIFDHFLHEFRHWMQSQVYRIGVREIDYTEEDVLNNTNIYYRNRLEIDARQFVRSNLPKFSKYYRIFTKICQ